MVFSGLQDPLNKGLVVPVTEAGEQGVSLFAASIYNGFRMNCAEVTDVRLQPSMKLEDRFVSR